MEDDNKEAESRLLAYELQLIGKEGTGTNDQRITTLQYLVFGKVNVAGSFAFRVNNFALNTRKREYSKISEEGKVGTNTVEIINVREYTTPSGTSNEESEEDTTNNVEVVTDYESPSATSSAPSSTSSEESEEEL